MDPRLLVRHFKLAACAALFPLAASAQPLPPAGEQPLNAVQRELSPDALFYTYIDFEGGWGQVGRELADTLKGSSLTERGLDLPGALDALGLSQIRALGMSSRAVTGGYDNRFFLYTPSGRAGLFSVFPGKPEPFQAAQFAPADADLVLDLRLDMPALIKTAETTALKFSNKKDSASTLLELLRAKEGNALPDLITYRGRIIAIVRMHDKERIEKAGAEFSRDLPFEFFAALESGGKAIAKALAQDAAWTRTEKNGRSYFTRKPDDSGREENIAIIIEGDRISVGSTTFAEECLAQKAGLAANADYTRALTDAAAEGHLLVYITPKLFKSLQEAAKWAFLLNSGMMQRSAHETMLASQFLSMLPSPEKPLTSVLVARDDGILIRGHSIESLKASLPGVALLTPDFLGRIATYAAKAWVIEDTRVHETERAQKEFQPQLQLVGETALKYFAANPDAESVTLTALKTAFPTETLPDFSAVSSTEIEILRASDVVNLEHNTLGTIQHILPLTDEQRAVIEKNLRAIDHAALEFMIAESAGYASASSLMENGWVEPKPVSILGEDYTSLSLERAEPRISVTTRGGQEIAITRDPQAAILAQRTIAERQLHVERNLAQALEAAARYFAANPDEYGISYDDLVAKDLLAKFPPIAGENYSDLSFSRDLSKVSLSSPFIGLVTYVAPPAPEAIASLRARLQKLESAAAAYFAKNPKAEIVIGGEIYSEPPAPADTTAHDDSAPAVVSDGSVPAITPDLTVFVIRRDYELIKATLENGYEVSVPRSKPKR